MELVKMVRDFPEVAGGNTTAMIPEDAVNLAMDNGWKRAVEKHVERETEKHAERETADVGTEDKRTKDSQRGRKKRDE